MTQEELDALMNINLDNLDIQDDEVLAKLSQVAIGEKDINNNLNNFFETNNKNTLLIKDNEMINNFSDTTEKRTEILEKIESISNYLVESEIRIKEAKEVIEDNINLFLKLNQEFPNIKCFKEGFEKNRVIKDKLREVIADIQMGQDEITTAVEVVQFQNIRKQKIERAMNAMKALLKYVNNLLDSNVSNNKISKKSSHSKKDFPLKDIEALISSFGKK